MNYAERYWALSNKYVVLAEALRIAGKYARDVLPAEIPTDMDYLSILANGQERDPEGYEYINKWIAMAEEKLREPPTE